MCFVAALKPHCCRDGSRSQMWKSVGLTSRARKVERVENAASDIMETSTELLAQVTVS
jgi:hypothetical protein